MLKHSHALHPLVKKHRIPFNTQSPDKTHSVTDAEEEPQQLPRLVKESRTLETSEGRQKAYSKQKETYKLTRCKGQHAQLKET